jgi:drug/metabolite transporter (DMT)-like permease
VNPIIAVVLGWLFASEPLSARTIVAAAVILGGVALITSGQAAKAATNGEHPLPTPTDKDAQRTAA